MSLNCGDFITALRDEVLHEVIYEITGFNCTVKVNMTINLTTLVYTSGS